MGPEETAQQLEALAALSEDPESILNIHTGLTNTHSSSSVGSNLSLLTPRRHQARTWCTHMHKNTQTHKRKAAKKKKDFSFIMDGGEFREASTPLRETVNG